jgi:four helix bundle protein
MSDFKQLKVWKGAHRVALAVYRSTSTFPSSERFGLVSQMRRAAQSVSANIAESTGRYGDRDQGRFLQMAKGSAKELECHLLLARDLRYLNAGECDRISGALIDVQRMLSTMIRNAIGSSGPPRAASSGSLPASVFRLPAPE